jgi:hypothetical protein
MPAHEGENKHSAESQKSIFFPSQNRSRDTDIAEGHVRIRRPDEA